MRKTSIILCLALIFVSINAYADSVTLKSGREIEGKILEMTNDAVKIEFEGVTITYFFDQIDKINGQPVSLPKQEVTQPVEPQPPKISQPVKETQKDRLTVQFDESKLSTSNQGRPSQQSSPSLNNLKLGKVNPKTVMALALFFGVLGILLYIYFSLCLQFIAQKTNNGPLFLAWIPIADFFLMLKIASLSYFWFFIFLVAFIPIIGYLTIFAFQIFLWYRISLARNKPGWLALLLIVPIVNFIIMGYLAFSE